MANPYSAETNMFVGAPTNTANNNHDDDDLFAGLDAPPAAAPAPRAAEEPVDPFAPPPPAAEPSPVGSSGSQRPQGGGGGGNAYDANPWDNQGFLQTGAGSGADGYYSHEASSGGGVDAPPPPVAAAVPIEALSAGSGGGGAAQQASPPAAGPLGAEASGGAAPAAADRSAEEADKEKENSGNFCKIAYYQKYFAVETSDVLERLKWALLLTTPRYMKKREERDAGNARPDMYGPLWVTTTLWVVLAVCYVLSGTFAYLEEAAPEDSSSGPDEMFNFKWVLTSMAVSYSYTYLVPLVLWCILKYKDINDLAMTKLICVYGYALTPFVVGSILTVVPMKTVQVLTIALLSLYSFAIIAKQLWPFTASFSASWKVGFIGFLLVAHGVATIFLYYEVLILSSSNDSPAPSPKN